MATDYSTEREAVSAVDDVVIVGGGMAGWMTAAYPTAVFGGRIRITSLDMRRNGA